MHRHRALLLLAAIPGVLAARKFYDDDPLIREPTPISIEKAKPRRINDIFDLFSHIFATPGEKQPPREGKIKAKDINTLGEVMDGPWYEARHGRRRMSIEELVAGTGNKTPPAEGPWKVISAKSEGVTPGFMIEDSRGVRFLIKFDPVTNPEMATAADVISSKFFHALGYHVPENYIVNFKRDQFKIGEGATFRDARGRKQPLTPKDVGEIMNRTYRYVGGNHRAVASRLIQGDLLHESRYYGTRADDPNDIVPHEHRRSLRGLHVFCAWLNHEDSRAINTLDVLVNEDGKRYVKHFLIDFGSTLGSASIKENSPRSGFEQFFTWRSAAKEFFTLGLWVPNWSRIDYREFPSVGRFSAEQFDPVKWTPEYPNPAFDNRLPGDTFWAARQVMAFTDDEIRAIVKTGKYSDPAAEQFVADTLIARRDAVGRAYLSAPLSLDGIRIEGGRLVFDDLAIRYGYQKPPQYTYQWSSFDNESERKTTLGGDQSNAIPESVSSEYLALDVGLAGNETRRVTIYLKRATSGYKIIGIDRVID